MLLWIICVVLVMVRLRVFVYAGCLLADLQVVNFGYLWFCIVVVLLILLLCLLFDLCWIIWLI